MSSSIKSHCDSHREDYNYTVYGTDNASFRPYRPRVYRYDVTTQSYELAQTLYPQTALAGLGSFTTAGQHYLVVHQSIYIYNLFIGK